MSSIRETLQTVLETLDEREINVQGENSPAAGLNHRALVSDW